MKLFNKGIRILTPPQKIDALKACINDNYFEDAAGHLCDLLEYCRTRAIGSDGKIFANLQAFVAYYGKDPTPIEDVRSGG